MNCYIYRASKKEDTYVYLEKKDEFEVIPEAVMKLLGELVFVMELDLGEREMLAHAEPQEVMEKIREQGFFLQLPPKQY